MSTNRDDFGIAIRSALLQRGARQKFSLFFLLCLSLLIFFFDRFPSNFMDKTRNILNDGIYRISSISTSPFKFITYISDKTENHFYIHEENKKLKKELDILRGKSFDLQFLKTENKILQDTIDTVKEINSSSSILAKVILDKQSPFLKSIIINKGSSSGIKKGMPVVSKKFLVGRIVEVNYFSSRVLLLNDLNSRIPIVTEGDGSQGILVGTGEKMPKINYLPDSFQMNLKKNVFTSGKDGVLPPGITIGEVSFDNTEIFVKLFVDTNQLSFVNVILTERRN